MKFSQNSPRGPFLARLMCKTKEGKGLPGQVYRRQHFLQRLPNVRSKGLQTKASGNRSQTDHGPKVVSKSRGGKRKSQGDREGIIKPLAVYTIPYFGGGDRPSPPKNTPGTRGLNMGPGKTQSERKKRKDGRSMKRQYRGRSQVN